MGTAEQDPDQHGPDQHGPDQRGPDLLGLADRFWQRQDALAGTPAPGGLAARPEVSDDGVTNEIEVVLATSDRDDLLLAILQARRNDTTDLEILGAGVLDDLAHDGDPDALARLRHYGVRAAIVAAIARSMAG